MPQRKRSLRHRIETRIFNRIEAAASVLWDQLPVEVRNTMTFKACKGIAVAIVRRLG